MSVKIMAEIWENSRQEGSSLLLLLAIADHASDDGVCWPGIARLAKKIRRSERHTKRLLADLVQCGEVYSAQGIGRGNTNHYLVTAGFTQDELSTTLIGRFDLDPHMATLAAGELVERPKGDIQGPNSDTDDTITEMEKVTPVTERVTSKAEKVTPVTEKGDAGDTRIIMNHHENHHESPCLEQESKSPHAAISEKQQSSCAMFSALLGLCQFDLETISGTQRGKLNKISKSLREKASASPADITAFGEFWYSEDWRGKKGQPPDPFQIQNEWGRFKVWRNGNRRSSNAHSTRNRPAGFIGSTATADDYNDPTPEEVAEFQAAVNTHARQRREQAAGAPG